VAAAAFLRTRAAPRRSDEATGRLREALEQEREAADACQRMLDVSRDHHRGMTIAKPAEWIGSKPSDCGAPMKHCRCLRRDWVSRYESEDISLTNV